VEGSKEPFKEFMISYSPYTRLIW